MIYNRQAAVAYAKKWALATHPRFPRFDNDCTSFVSQTLLAGGWTMAGERSFLQRTRNDVWWYGGSFLTRASYTWAGAHNLYQFLRVSRRGIIAGSKLELALGDVVQIRTGNGHVYHSMVVTGKTSNDLLLSYHTADHLDEPLAAIESRLPSDHALVFWRIVDNRTE
jgi:hypothetical protein